VFISKESELQLFVYDDLNLIEYEDFKVSDLDKYIGFIKQIGLIFGLNNVEWLKSIGHYFEIDNFILADILNTTRRTKLEESHDFCF
jgi:magnesium transporter